MGITAAVRSSPIIAYMFLSPDCNPTAKGKIMFPAPKNMENRARPIARDWDFKMRFIIYT
jgi:hypothetical protein